MCSFPEAPAYPKHPSENSNFCATPSHVFARRITALEASPPQRAPWQQFPGKVPKDVHLLISPRGSL